MQPYADSELKQDLHAAVRTAQELGPEYESEIMDGFLKRLDSRLDAQVAVRVQRELDRRTGGVPAAGRERREPRGFGSRFHYFSLALAIPLTAISAGTTGLPGLITVWLGIVGVNTAHSLGGALARRRDEHLATRDRLDGWD